MLIVFGYLYKHQLPERVFSLIRNCLVPVGAQRQRKLLVLKVYQVNDLPQSTYDSMFSKIAWL